MKQNGSTAGSRFLRRFVFLAAALMAFLMCSGSVHAALINRVEAKTNGKVEVGFKTDVKYKKVKVEVIDAYGRKLPVKITEKEDDELEFRIKNYKAGVIYMLEISGIRKKSASKYTSEYRLFMLPVLNEYFSFNSCEYDEKDKKVEFGFSGSVQWKDVKCIITDGKKQYVTKIDEKDKNSIELKVKKLEKEKLYGFVISGVRRKGDKKYYTISGTFMA